MSQIYRANMLGVSPFALVACRDPFSIGVAISSAFLTATGVALAVSPTLIGAIALAGLSIGAQVLRSAFAKPNGLPPHEYKNAYETSEGSEVRGIGRTLNSGLVAFANTKGKDRYRLILHTKGVVSGVEHHFLGGREVILDGVSVSSPPYVRKGGSYVFIKSKIGDGTETAWPELMEQFPDLWTEDHRVQGIAQSLVRYVSPGTDKPKFLKLYQSGEPAYSRIQRNEPVFDPRDPTQSVDDPATWKWSDNAILCAYHILRSYPSFTSADFDWEHAKTEADRADALVPLKGGGTEPRARCWGFWASESKRGEVMDQVLRSIGAEIVPGTDGKNRVRLIDDVQVAEAFIPAIWIDEINWRSGPESVERPNVCRLRYYSPERNYEMTDVKLDDAPWARYQTEIDRVGEQPFEDADLPFCPSNAQGQRIARRLFALARSDMGTIITNFVGVGLFWGKSVVDVEFPDIGEDGGSVIKTCAIGTPRVDDENGKVEIPFVVWPDLTPWDPQVDEMPAPEPIPDLQYPSDLETPAKPSVAYLVGGELRIRFTEVPDAEDGEASFRTYDADGLPGPWQAMSEYYASGTTWYAYSPAGAAGLIADPALDTATGWTLEQDWTLADGKLTKVAGSTARSARRPVSLRAGRTYDWSATIDATNGSANLYVRLFGSTATDNVSSASIASAGLHTGSLVANASTVAAGFAASAQRSVTIDSFQLSDRFQAGDRVDFRVRFFNAEEEGSYWSETLEVASIAVNNVAPPMPGLTVIDDPSTDQFHFTVTTDAIQAARVAIKRGTTTIHSGTIRPGQPYEVSLSQTVEVPGSVTFDVTVLTSNSTASPAATQTFNYDNPL